jgi:hypothetical protein
MDNPGALAPTVFSEWIREAIESWPGIEDGKPGISLEHHIAAYLVERLTTPQF